MTFPLLPENFYHTGIVVQNLAAAAERLTAAAGYNWAKPIKGPVTIRTIAGAQTVEMQFVYSLQAPHLELIEEVPGTALLDLLLGYEEASVFDHTDAFGDRLFREQAETAARAAHGEVELRRLPIEVDTRARDSAEIDDAGRRVQHVEHYREQRRAVTTTTELAAPDGDVPRFDNLDGRPVPRAFRRHEEVAQAPHAGDVPRAFPCAHVQVELAWRKVGLFNEREGGRLREPQ